jgi:hypothetical protein
MFASVAALSFEQAITALPSGRAVSSTRGVPTLLVIFLCAHTSPIGGGIGGAGFDSSAQRNFGSVPHVKRSLPPLHF